MKHAHSELWSSISILIGAVIAVLALVRGKWEIPLLLAVFALCYVDEPIRYVIMQRHMYSRKWIRPVSSAGKATIEAFRQKYNVRI